jgi:hypothetical protein
MATTVFSGGHELPVTESVEDLLTRLGNDNAMTVQARHLRLQGWMQSYGGESDGTQGHRCRC